MREYFLHSHHKQEHRIPNLFSISLIGDVLAVPVTRYNERPKQPPLAAG